MEYDLGDLNLQIFDDGFLNRQITVNNNNYSLIVHYHIIDNVKIKDFNFIDSCFLIFVIFNLNKLNNFLFKPFEYKYFNLKRIFAD